MTKPPYRALRIVLRVVALLSAGGGLLAIFSGKPLAMRLFLNPPEAEISTLLLLMMKETGGLALVISLILFVASRDPARHRAVIDSLIGGLCILAVTPLLSLYTLELDQLYRGSLLWGRSIGRLAIAGLLFYLRPREIQVST